MTRIPFATRIIEMKRESLRNRPSPRPTTLHISATDEDDLFEFLPLLSPADVKRAHSGELRQVFDKLYGLTVVYDAGTTRVE